MPRPPPPPPSGAKPPALLAGAISEWRALTATLATAKAREHHLRAFIVAQAFSVLKEGANERQLGPLTLKVNHKLSRRVDETVVNAEFARQLKGLGVSLDRLLEYSPSLVLKEYRRLSTQQRRAFDCALVIKESTPTLEILVP